MIERANAFLHRYALLLLLVFVVFVFFDLFYVSPVSRDIAAKRALIRSADERIEGLAGELKRLRGIEGACRDGLAAILAATADYGPASREIEFLHALNGALDREGLESGPLTVRRAEDAALRCRLLSVEFDWEGSGTAACGLLNDIAGFPGFVTVDAFALRAGRDGRADGALTVSLRSRPAR